MLISSKQLGQGIFDTLALPPALEQYRFIVFDQLYTKCPSVILQSVCWATSQLGLPVNDQTPVQVFPGEEAYRMLAGKDDIPDGTLGATCPHHREETSCQPVIDEMPETGFTCKTTHHCQLPPTERPLLCRLWPTWLEPGNPRSAVINAPIGARSMLQRLGDVRINQMLHDTANVFIYLWNFLIPSWWGYYLNYTPTACDKLTTFTFELSDDLIYSTIRGAQPIWRESLLQTIARPDCPACEGVGVEFWDRYRDLTTGESKFLPVQMRKFDLCRECVLPKLGMFHKGVVVSLDRKILSPDGSFARGDTLLKKELS